MSYRYQVIRLWEQDAAPLLTDSALLPLASLAQTDSPRLLLEQVAAQVAMIEEINQQQIVSAYTQLLAGLRFKKTLIRQIFREGVMQDSVIYQEIYQTGKQEGRQAGEAALILRLLNRRFGAIAPQAQAQIQALPLLELETLGEALLDWSDVADLKVWLQTNRSSQP